MTLKTDLYINGAWVPGDSTVPVYDPSDGSVIAEVSTASEAQCDAAIEAAHTALPLWAKTAPRVRAEILRKAFEIMTAEAEEIAKLVSRENGKVLTDAKGEVAYAAEFFRWFAEEAVRTPGDFRMSPSGDKRILVTHQPIGVSLLITPWNFPAAMATRKIGPALAAGCTVILKPATETPLTALWIADIMERAGAPKGVVNVILPAKTGAAISKMLHDPRVRNLSFTGSTEVGRILLREASDCVIRTSMELGGNAPFLVLDDANIDEAVKGAMVAKMRNGGAACTAANRFYIARAVADEFIAKFTVAMGELVVAAGLEAGAQLGASVSIKERNKIAELVDASVADGAEVKIGGKTLEGVGAFYPATVLKVEKNNMILKQEVFGPVAPIVIFDTDEEAIELANNTEYGLISYVFSSELGRAIRTAEKMESGMVAINRGVVSDPAAPFGGVKQSGLGREGGFAGIHEFLETKYIGVEI
ncbi:MAG: NAD-dependent succinate-semialdehyde dehydrogenase [Candidatus Planktophila sp.]|jgi:succinate-semialdehyde dehydrogenase / glutarate-semialdehyde dehydrogenase|tara:strand:- start:288 stop:1712 length:1425 start_codon:yes stop_codon:yes gene_type:complete